MKKIRKFLFSWGPLIIWACFIFALSSQEHIKVSDMKYINFLIFKSLHVIEYFIFYCLAVYASIKSKIKEPYLFALYIGILFALFDEIHQMYVPTREGAFRDILVDSFGLVLGYYVSRIPILKKYI